MPSVSRLLSSFSFASWADATNPQCAPRTMGLQRSSCLPFCRPPVDTLLLAFNLFHSTRILHHLSPVMQGAAVKPARHSEGSQKVEGASVRMYRVDHAARSSHSTITLAELATQLARCQPYKVCRNDRRRAAKSALRNLAFVHARLCMSDPIACDREYLGLARVVIRDSQKPRGFEIRM